MGVVYQRVDIHLSNVAVGIFVSITMAGGRYCGLSGMV
jgi:hypothetical protein